MAFPVIQTADTKTGTVTTNSTSWTLTYPTNLQSGDLIFAFIAMDGDGPGAAGTLDATGFTKRTWRVIADPISGGCIYKVSDGTETGNFTLTIASNEQGAWRIFRITNWGGNLSTDIEFSVNSTNSNANPDPQPLNPTNWATEDTLWFAACAVDTSRTISVYPLADNNTADVSGGANGATLGLCSTNSAVASLDPGTFTISTADDWSATTVAIRPGTGAQTVSPGLINQAASTFSPTITTGAVNVSLALLSQTAATFTPTISATYSISLALLDRTAVASAPTIATGGGTQSVSLALINQAASPSAAAVYHSPGWTTPADGVSMGVNPELKFIIPNLPSPMYFHIQIDKANTFDTVDLREIYSNLDQTGWDYWNGSAWTPVPSTGVLASFAGNEARYTVQTALDATTWYRRVRAGV